MKHIKKINELLRTTSFNNVTHTPYLNEKPNSLGNSRFVEYSTKNQSGWLLVAMQPMDEKFNDIGSTIQIKRFIVENDLNEKALKNAITSALGELARQPWIDEYEMPSIKQFAFILLGKLGIKVKGKYYSPRLIYQDVPKSGNTFWMGASSVKISKETPDDNDPLFFDKYDNSFIKQHAKSIAVLPDDYSNSEITNIARIRINAAKKRSWELDQEERKANNLPPNKKKYKQYEPAEFSDIFIVIHDPKAKTEFLIYSDENPVEQSVEFAKNAITGQKIQKDRKQLIEPGMDHSRERMDHGVYFSLNPKDSKLEIFQYFNTKPNIHELNTDKYTTVKLIKGSVKPVKQGQTDFREVSVETITGPKPGTKLTLKISAGDKMVVSTPSRGSTEKKGELAKREVIVEKTPIEPTINKERIAIKIIK